METGNTSPGEGVRGGGVGYSSAIMHAHVACMTILTVPNLPH